MKHGYSCDRCAEWFFVDPTGKRVTAPCPLCDGAMTYRGPVERDGRVIGSSEYGTPCDEQCTSARGVKCNCRCGGQNHGSHRHVRVTWIEGVARIDLSDVPYLAALRGKRLPEIEEAERLAETITAVIMAKYGHVIERRRAGEWLGTDEYRALGVAWGLMSTVRKAKAYKLPSARVRALRKLAERLEVSESEGQGALFAVTP